MYSATALLSTFAILIPGLVSGMEITYDCAEVPNICMNFCWATACQGLMHPLHGGAQVDANANRIAIGTGSGSKAANENWGFSTQAPIGSAARDATSPDEYPLASSNEGGLNKIGSAVSPALRMATFGTGPAGQKGEQNVQGGLTTRIGSRPPTEEIWFVLQNIDKLPVDWCNPIIGKTTQCINDGHQFTLQRNAKGEWDPTMPYVLATPIRRRDEIVNITEITTKREQVASELVPVTFVA